LSSRPSFFLSSPPPPLPGPIRRPVSTCFATPFFVPCNGPDTLAGPPPPLKPCSCCALHVPTLLCRAVSMYTCALQDGADKRAECHRKPLRSPELCVVPSIVPRASLRACRIGGLSRYSSSSSSSLMPT
jgi:hypothetical protein